MEDVAPGNWANAREFAEKIDPNNADSLIENAREVAGGQSASARSAAIGQLEPVEHSIIEVGETQETKSQLPRHARVVIPESAMPIRLIVDRDGRTITTRAAL